MTFRGGIREKHTDLAVLDPARSPGIHPRHPGTLGSLLQKAGLIDDQHTVIVCQMFDDISLKVVANLVRIPLRPGNKMLQILWRVVAQIVRQLPAVLAIDLRDQPADIKRSPPLQFDPSKPWSQLVTDPLQFATPTLNVSCRHIPTHLAILPSKMYKNRISHGSATVVLGVHGARLIL